MVSVTLLCKEIRKSEADDAIIISSKMACNLVTSSNGTCSVTSDFEGKSFSIDPSYKPKKLKTSDTELKSIDLDYKHESRVLALYTGGTIGMCIHDGVYTPEPNFLVSELRKLSIFHDQEYLVKHSICDGGQTPTPWMQSPLCMPLSKEKKNVVYCVYEYEPLLDSSNMTMDDWARIASDIKTYYEDFDGFVILHGTDTMAYTASALSFMFENLGKPIILTGSQIPIFETRSDGRDNLLGALIMAGNYCIPEVMIFFNNKLLRGNRSTKFDSSSFDAFHSPNFPPLAVLETKIHVDWDEIFTSNTTQKCTLHTNLCPSVGLLRLFPSITTATVRQFLAPPLKGMVLESYGAGNAPDSRKDLMQVFSEATERGVLLLNITQCHRGSVNPSYATGKALIDAGVIPGSDMTPEAALTKLAFVIGREDWSLEHKRKKLSQNIRGELKTARTESLVSDFKLIDSLGKLMKISSKEEMQTLKDAIFPSLMCTAAQNGDLAVLQKIREGGGHIGMVDYSGRSPLHIACGKGHFHIVQYLLQHGAPLHVRDNNGRSPLYDAVKLKHLDIVRLLVQTGAHLVLPPYKLGSELCLSAAQDDVDSLKAWALSGANLSQGDYDGRTALHVAASHGHQDSVEFLLEQGVSVTAEDRFGYTPLKEATAKGHREISKLILDAVKPTVSRSTSTDT
ncbi:L-asparaginase-like [Lingula anatina]|uniref:asparaginase n=1 Tax=Lingula anatina TaxID=7574 RepID=A0A1S3JID1_LINAN|nr:L-asparaginase-like [Lingula anatina]|eukprot:XP_013409896.1 L-asparaginase-like [Lingula anatina]